MATEARRNGDVAQFRSRLQEGQRRIREAYLADGDSAAMLAGRCLLIDDILRDLWCSQELPASLTLVAVGGYGRGELYPASDVDLLILLGDTPDDALKCKLEALVGHLWDIGLEIGTACAPWTSACRKRPAISRCRRH